MLTINPSSLRATLGDAAANAATGGSPSGSSADPAGFASLLRQTQVVSAPSPTFTPAPAPAPAAATDKEPANEPAPANEASDDAPAPQESDATRRTHPVLKGKLRGTDGATVAPRDAKPTADTGDSKRPEAADKTAAGDCKAPETKLTSTEAPIDPNVMQWLAGLQRAAAGQTEAAQAGVDGKTVPADTDTGVIEARGAAKGSLAADLKAEADLKDKAAQGTAQLTDAAGTNPFAAALTEQGGIVEKPQVKMFDGVKDASPTGAAGVAPPPTGGSTVAAPAAVAIATPVTAPDFAQELGLRLSTLAKDGVQTAELHLNPADMGPVSVQIVMDGTQARVDFGADMAATRQAIEAGLPELASALADAGFTLAGGGVSQHAGGRSGGGNDPGSSNGDNAPRIVTEDQVKRIATAARRAVTRGGIDLFA